MGPGKLLILEESLGFFVLLEILITVAEFSPFALSHFRQLRRTLMEQVTDSALSFVDESTLRATQIG